MCSRYTGMELSGQTILLMGNTFSLNLTSDGSVTNYGFSIIQIAPLTEEEYLNYGA